MAVGVDPGEDALAYPVELEPVTDQVSSMLHVYYYVTEEAKNLNVTDRIRVALPLNSSSVASLAVPYSAVYYDSSGGAWVYVAQEANVFQRHPITIEWISGDWAVLSAGPIPGTKVVTVGAALLFGTEGFRKMIPGFIEQKSKAREGRY